jgi:isochorismate pyruvate lyase
MDKLPPNSGMVIIRQEIDSLDRELVTLLSARQRLIERAIAVKTVEGLPALIPSRVDQVISQAVAKACETGLHPELAKEVWTTMVNWFVAYEKAQLGR